MKYPKVREVKGALHSLFTKPYTTSFPVEPHIPFDSFRGKPKYTEEKCIGCTACVNVCPASALTSEDVRKSDGATRILRINWDYCIQCGQCQANCPTAEGIMLSQEFDIATTEKREELYQLIEKEMALCEHCQEPIAPKDQLAWTIQKLGPLYTSNTTLVTFQQEALAISSSFPFEREEFLRCDRFRLLCPLCRREAVFSS